MTKNETMNKIELIDKSKVEYEKIMVEPKKILK